MSRHNRRRTRGGHGKLPSPTTNSSGSLYPSSLIPNCVPISGSNFALEPILTYRTGISARQWHNRYMAWQARDKRQREERMRLEEEKKRIFGMCGEDGDLGSGLGDGGDDGLCEKMLEYFGGLDFIE